MPGCRRPVPRTVQGRGRAPSRIRLDGRVGRCRPWSVAIPTRRRDKNGPPAAEGRHSAPAAVSAPVGRMDRITPERRSALMARIRPTDTAPEIAVRRLAHALGCRFRLHRRDLPGTPDLVFPRLGKAVLVHGCFWHRHPDPGCRNAVLPKTRQEWWRTKLLGNAARDARNMERLSAMGWQVLVLWECEIRSGVFEGRLAEFLGAADRLPMLRSARATPPDRARSRSDRRSAP